MKIIQISSYYPPHLGGQENVAKEISERLAKKGHQVEVFTSDIGCSKDKQLKSTKNLKIHYLKSKEFAHTPIIPSLYKELMKIPKDSIMHVHIAQAFVPEIVYSIWKKRKIPYVAHIHIDVEPSSWIGKIILKPYKRILLKKFLKNAIKIIVLTEDYKELINKKYRIDKSKIIVVPVGIKNELIHLLFVGRVSAQKDLKLLIKSIAICKSKLILDIVGDGDLLKETKELAEQNNINNIVFHGRLTGKNLVKTYQNSDIFISTTKQESFGITYLEAMASGLPIITSNVLGVRNVVKNGYNGLLVEPTPQKIADAIEKLIANPKLRKKLAQNGLKEVKKYSWKEIIKQFERVYHGIHNKK